MTRRRACTGFGWTVTGVAPVRFRVRDNALWLRIGSLGCRVILR